MAGTRRTVLPARVGVVGQRIERWRRARRKRSPMPEDLWSAAVGLAREHGVWPIARALGVSYATLKQRSARDVAEFGEISAGPSSFVEIDATQLIGSAEVAPATAVLEFSDGDGARLTVRLGRGQDLDLGAVADAFWRRGR